MTLITMERHSLSDEESDKRVSDAIATFGRKSEYSMNFDCKATAIEYLLDNGFKLEEGDHYSKKTLKRTLDAWVSSVSTQVYKRLLYSGFVTYLERKGLW